MVTWVMPSRTKRWRMRGPNWVVAIDSTRSATEKISARTVLTAPRRAPRIARASSGPPMESQVGKARAPWATERSTATVAANNSTARRHMTRGTRHRSALNFRTSWECALAISGIVHVGKCRSFPEARCDEGLYCCRQHRDVRSRRTAKELQHEGGHA